jgi:hypothetical protein
MGKARKTRDSQGGARKSREARQIRRQARPQGVGGQCVVHRLFQGKSRSILWMHSVLACFAGKIKALAATAAIVEPAADFVCCCRLALRKPELARSEPVMACARPQQEPPLCCGVMMDDLSPWTYDTLLTLIGDDVEVCQRLRAAVEGLYKIDRLGDDRRTLGSAAQTTAWHRSQAKIINDWCGGDCFAQNLQFRQGLQRDQLTRA